MKRTIKIIINWFKLQRIRFQMREVKLEKAIKEADRLHKETGKRFRVFFFGGKYHVWTRTDIRERQASGLLKWNRKAGADFDRISFYDTNKIKEEKR